MSFFDRGLIDTERSTAVGKPGYFRLYVWAITASAVLIVTLMVWPFSVTQYSSTAEIHLTIDPKLVEQQSANERVANSIARHTSDERLEELIADSQTAVPVRSALVQSGNLDALRNVLRVATRPHNGSHRIDLQISMVGAGTRDEVELINRLTNAVATDLTALPAQQHISEVLDTWSGEFRSAWQQRHRVKQQTIALLADQLDGALRKQEYWLAMLGGEWVGLGEESDEFESIALQFQIAELYQAIRQQQAANDWPAHHPELVALRDRLDQVRGRLDQLYRPGGTSRVQNQFLNASSTVHRHPEGDESREEIRADLLDLSPVELAASQSILLELERGLLAEPEFHQEWLGRLHHQLERTTGPGQLIGIEGLRLARRSQPIEGGPNSRQVLGILMLSLTIGGLIALQFKPELCRSRFQSAEQAGEALGIPLLGVLRWNAIRPTRPNTQQWVLNLLLRVSEYTLLFGAAILLIAMLVNSDLFGAVMENPFHALSQVLRMLLPD